MTRPEHSDQLRSDPVRRADEAGPLDLAYRTLDSPVGRLLLAATPHGVVRIAFETEGFDEVLGVLADRIGPRVRRAPARLDPLASELDEYFAGHRHGFAVPLDWSLTSGFRRSVQQLLPSVGFGATATYKDLATALGNPGAVRAVGSACATNPLPIVVPCHRVLRSDGSLGGYRGGLSAKSYLLELEAAAV